MAGNDYLVSQEGVQSESYQVYELSVFWIGLAYWTWVPIMLAMNLGDLVWEWPLKRFDHILESTSVGLSTIIVEHVVSGAQKVESSQSKLAFDMISPRLHIKLWSGT